MLHYVGGLYLYLNVCQVLNNTPKANTLACRDEVTGFQTHPVEVFTCGSGDSKCNMLSPEDFVCFGGGWQSVSLKVLVCAPWITTQSVCLCARRRRLRVLGPSLTASEEEHFGARTSPVHHSLHFPHCPPPPPPIYLALHAKHTSPRQQAGSNAIPSLLSRLPITSHSVATVSKATERSGCQAPRAMHGIVTYLFNSIFICLFILNASALAFTCAPFPCTRTRMHLWACSLSALRASCTCRPLPSPLGSMHMRTHAGGDATHDLSPALTN